MIDLGDVYRISIPVTDPDGALINPATASLTITLPDGTTVAPTVTLPPAVTGMVTVDYPTVQAGTHRFVLTTTVPQTAYRSVFDVRAAETTSILSLATAKSQLGITNDTNDAELRSFIESVTQIVAGYVGTLGRATHIETVCAAGATLPLTYYPVTAITSIEPVYTGGSSIDPSSVDVDEYGIVRLLSGGSITGLYRVTYTAGFTSLPANYTRAAAIILQHMWETQRPRDSRRPPTMMSEDFMAAQDASGRFFSVPRRAVELLQHDVRSGFA